MNVITTNLISKLQCPESGAELSLEDDALVAQVEGGRRYPVRGGIPLLLPDSGASAAQRLRDRSIVEAFRGRSQSYYADNYGLGGNPERQARQARVTTFLEDAVLPGMSVLEAGAGPAALAESILRLTDEYVALDLSLENLLVGRRRAGQLDAVVGNLTALPVKDEVFDGVVAVGCLEYLVELERGIGELSRVTRSGGFVLASFANARSPRRWWDETVTNRLSRLRRRRRGESTTIYRRHLVSPGIATNLFANAGITTERLVYLNAGLLGYPFSRSERLDSMQAHLATRFNLVRRSSSEFLVLGRKNGTGESLST